MLPLAFNPIALSEANNLPIGVDLDRIAEKDNESYFRETMSFLVEMQKEFTEADKCFYRGIVESAGNDVIIQESFGDFFTKIKEIIDKFLRFIKSLFERFITKLNSFIKREKYIIKHENEFGKFTSVHEFRHTGYEYSFSPEVPVISAQAEFNNGFIFNVGDDDKPTSIPSDENAMKTSLTTLNTALNNGEWYDKFRASVIGSDGIILKSDFAKELFSQYRSGASSPEDIEITSSEVASALTRLKAHDSATSSVRRTKESIDREYNQIKKRLDNMLKINYADGNKVTTIYGAGNNDSKVLTGAEITTMDLFVKAKVNQVQEMSNIHALAFSAKLDALNDCFKQDKAVLYRALSKIQGTAGKEGL